MGNGSEAMGEQANGLPDGWEWTRETSLGCDVLHRHAVANPGNRFIASAYQSGAWRAYKSDDPVEDHLPIAQGTATAARGEEGYAARRAAEAALWRVDGYGRGEVRGVHLPAIEPCTKGPTALPGLPGLWTVTRWVLSPTGSGVEVDARKVDEDVGEPTDPEVSVHVEVARNPRAFALRRVEPTPVASEADDELVRLRARVAELEAAHLSASVFEQRTAEMLIAKVAELEAERAQFVTLLADANTWWSAHNELATTAKDPGDARYQEGKAHGILHCLTAIEAALSGKGKATAVSKPDDHESARLTDAQKARRGALIDRDVDGPALHESEQAELAALERLATIQARADLAAMVTTHEPVTGSARPSPDRAAWLLHPVSSAGRQTIAASQYEELRREAVALRANPAARGEPRPLDDTAEIVDDPDALGCAGACGREGEPLIATGAGCAPLCVRCYTVAVREDERRRLTATPPVGSVAEPTADDYARGAARAAELGLAVGGPITVEQVERGLLEAHAAGVAMIRAANGGTLIGAMDQPGTVEKMRIVAEVLALDVAKLRNAPTGTNPADYLQACGDIAEGNPNAGPWLSGDGDCERLYQIAAVAIAGLVTCNAGPLVTGAKGDA